MTRRDGICEEVDGLFWPCHRDHGHKPPHETEDSNGEIIHRWYTD